MKKLNQKLKKGKTDAEKTKWEVEKAKGNALKVRLRKGYIKLKRLLKI